MCSCPFSSHCSFTSAGCLQRHCESFTIFSWLLTWVFTQCLCLVTSLHVHVDTQWLTFTLYVLPVGESAVCTPSNLGLFISQLVSDSGPASTSTWTQYMSLYSFFIIQNFNNLYVCCMMTVAEKRHTTKVCNAIKGCIYYLSFY